MDRFEKIAAQTAILVVALFVSFCSKSDDTGNNQDPVNLVIQILSVDHESGKVTLQANADNAVQYQLFIGSSQVSEASNQDGFFEYVFDNPGSYIMSVRAYGASGRYIRAEQVVNIISESGTVPLSEGYFTPEEHPGYSLVWQDEFNGNSKRSTPALISD